MNKKLKIILILMMTTVLFNCGSTPTCELAKVVIPDPLNIERYNQKNLRCLRDFKGLNGTRLDKVVVTRHVQCESRVETLRNKLIKINE